jgi:periplasmic divalent cation tolerance protein
LDLLGGGLLGVLDFMVGNRLGPQDGHANMERALLVYTTPGMVSHYWWQGAIERGEEVVMIIKTRASLTDRVCAAVKAGHSYTTPALLVLPVERVDPAYLEWLMAETATATAT